MTFDIKLTITGIQELQAWNIRAIAAMKPKGAFGQAIIWGTTEAHRYAVSITHVDTGALRASHRMAIEGLQGRIYIDPNTRNPRTGESPAEYGMEEHARGGSHAFYGRTIEEAGGRIHRGMGKIIMEAL